MDTVCGMEESHRNAIQKNFSALVEQTDLEHMVRLLHDKGVFSDRMIERYSQESKSVRDRKRLLYRDITHRGPDAFRHLIDSLQEAGYWQLARDLDPNSRLHLQQQIYSSLPCRNLDNRHDNSFISLRAERERKKGEEARQKSPVELGIDEQEGTEMPHYDVKKSTKYFEDNGKDLKLYPMRGPRNKRGVLVMFNYYKFDSNTDHDRKGVPVDCHRLQYLFDELGFRVLVYKNIGMEVTLSTLENMNSVLKGTQCVFVVVSSHGYSLPKGSSDAEFRISDGHLMSVFGFLNYFSNKNLPDLIGVPKVFIFQMCRGNKKTLESMEDVAHTTSVDGAPWSDEPAERPASIVLTDKQRRLFSDILIAHSTVPGFESNRDVLEGSWYIQVLCKVFAEHAHDHHVEDLFALVDEQLAERYKSQTSSIDRWGFNRKLYLHPGLYDD